MPRPDSSSESLPALSTSFSCHSSEEVQAPGCAELYAELRALRECQNGLQRYVEEWTSHQGFVSNKILAKQEHVEEMLKQVCKLCNSQNETSRPSVASFVKTSPKDFSTTASLEAKPPLPILLNNTQNAIEPRSNAFAGEDSQATDRIQSCVSSMPSECDSLEDAAVCKTTTEELLMLDARHHWRRMIRKGQSLPRRDSISKPSIEDLSCLERFTKSHKYETVVLVLVVSNTAFIGWSVQHQAIHHKTHAFHSIGETIFFVAFLMELTLRIFAEGREFFMSRERGWNLFDLIIVGMMVLEQLLRITVDLGSASMPQLSSVRLLRIIRLVRVVRVIRVLKFFHELRIMIQSILGSFKFLVWVVSVMVLMFYIFGLSLTQGVINHCDSADSWQCNDSESLSQYFGSLDRSTLSLFQAMSGGVNWSDLLDALGPVHPAYKGLLLLYIAISIFAVVNIVTGIFVDYALQSSQADRDLAIQEEIYAKEEYVRSMQSIFDEMDLDGDGTIGLSEFEAAIKDERMVSYFSALGLEITDIKGLFVLLDRDQTGNIDTEEFVLGCMRLKGGARSLDMAKLQYESEWVVHNLEILTDLLKERFTHRGTTRVSTRRYDSTCLSSPTNGNRRFPTV